MFKLTVLKYEIASELMRISITKKIENIGGKTYYTYKKLNLRNVFLFVTFRFSTMI